MLRVSRAVSHSVRSSAARSFSTATEGRAEGEWSPEVYSATDPWQAQYHMKVDMLLDDVLKIPKAEQAAFKENYEVSQGHFTLEWCHPSPMPFHTYEELAIIKEID